MNGEPYITASLRPASNGRDLDEAVLVGVSDPEDVELVGLVETTLQAIGGGGRDPVGDFLCTPEAWPHLHRVLLRAGCLVICGVGVEG